MGTGWNRQKLPIFNPSPAAFPAPVLSAGIKGSPPAQPEEESEETDEELLPEEPDTPDPRKRQNKVALLVALLLLEVALLFGVLAWWLLW